MSDGVPKGDSALLSGRFMLELKVARLPDSNGDADASDQFSKRANFDRKRRSTSATLPLRCFAIWNSASPRMSRPSESVSECA